ncbi:protein UBASH3A homolog isoform X2 [Harmonia axyridis]|uniref:protein UBASH3A homolog isoform X2 n=1 Tax=Harmonia axyridis TaxID=115357 RepID=UPI001E278B99|nr:protein UBASH3A homolog isoform X2 [Harmonia axyridis]
MTSNSTLPVGKSANLNMVKPNQSPLQTLLQIGLPKHRAEKALAATGNQSAEIATNWLLSHVNDPFLDDNSPREYILYACPTVISDTYEHFDALTACFPWCTTTTARCIPRGSRSLSHEPHAKSLHLTLAYQFPNNQFDGLKALVDELDPNATAEWELRLYSKDPRINGKQVYKVIREYIPTETDDLELKIGDYLYVSSEALNSSISDDWLEGTSWSTGASGYFLESNTCRVPESDAWTLHKSIPLNKCEHLEDMGERHEELSNTQMKEFMKDRMIADLSNVEATTTNYKVKSNQRSIFVLRHAERVDFVFRKWISHCFDDAGNYLRKDLNLPHSIPSRRDGPEGYGKDSPITNVGCFHARSIGEVFKSNDVNIDHVYCSPSFRCVQTLDAFLQGIGKKENIKIRVEPCLFEWTLWYPKVPDWMSVDELVSAGYNIDTQYNSFKNVSDIKVHETIENFYARSTDFLKKVMDDHPTGNVLLLGHSATLDTMTRHLVQGKEARNKDELFGLINKIPYCSLVQVTEEENKWKFVDPPCPPMTHCVNHRFDWKVLLSN